MATPVTRTTFRSVFLLAFVGALPACSNCGEKKKEPVVVIVDDGGEHSFRRRPFERHRRDGGVPRFLPRFPASDASLLEPPDDPSLAPPAQSFAPTPGLSPTQGR